MLSIRWCNFVTGYFSHFVTFPSAFHSVFGVISNATLFFFSFVHFYFVSLSLFWPFCANVSAARLRMARFRSHFRSHFILQLVLVRRFRFAFTLSLFFPIHLSLSRFVHQLGGRFIFSQIKCTNVVVEKLNWIRRSVFGYYHIQRLLGLQFCAQKPYEIAKRLQSKYAKQTDSDAGDCTHSLPFMRMICVFFLLLPQCRVLSKICFSRRVTKKA